MSYGENHYKPAESCFKSIHAEDHAIRKLVTLPKQKKLKKVDMLVIRVSKTGVMGNSKPCAHCIHLLAHQLPSKGYMLSRVFFSNDKGVIESHKFNDLYYEEDQHISRYYKERSQKNV